MKAKVPEMITVASHRERIQYLDMICLMALHEVFGFGPERLRRYYDAIGEMDAHYSRYNGRNEPVFGRKTKDGYTRMDLYAVKRDLNAIGVDYDRWVDEDLEGKPGEGEKP